MSNYAKFNIFVGKYEIPANGAIPLDNATMEVKEAKETEEGLVCGGENSDVVALVLNDNFFWPMIGILTPEEAESLARRLIISAEMVRRNQHE